MISVNKSKVNKPTKLDNEQIAKKLLKIKDEGKPGEKINDLYNDDDVRNALNQLYHNKCAYCEGLTNTAKFTSRIDHYRPKNGIKGVTNHKGYYWLGYEWTNLLPTCEKCNIKKSNQFPLKDETTRITDNLKNEGFLLNNEFVLENFTISKLTKEQRLLLNPEIDEVEKHLYFLPNGEVRHLTDEGEITIKVCDLNRSSLIYERKKIVDDLIRNLIETLLGDNYISLAKELKNYFTKNFGYSNELEYSRFRFFICEFFNYFITDKIEELGLKEIAKIIEEEYIEYKKQQSRQ